MHSGDTGGEKPTIDENQRPVVFSGLEPLIELIARLLVDHDLNAQIGKQEPEKG